MERRLFTVYHRNSGPERLAALPTPIPHVEGNDLTRCGVHRDPHPLLVGFLLHEALHLVGFRFQSGQHHGCWACWELDMEILGTGRKAFHHEVQEPRETDTHGTADPAQRDALTQQVFHHSAPLIRNEAVVGHGTKLDPQEGRCDTTP
jgi:hypothetical protein